MLGKVLKMNFNLKLMTALALGRAFAGPAVALLLVTIAVVSPAVAEEAEADAIASYGHWSVFKDEEMCWVATYTDIVETSGETSVNLDPFAFVSFQEGSMQPVISFELEELVAPDMTAKVGGREVDLVLADGALFTDNDTELLFQMLENDILLISNDETLVAFNLYRLRDAYNHVAKICDFHYREPSHPSGVRLKS
jgi:hypothetical protein